MTKILVVDDNEPNLYMLQVLLPGHGYEVVPATNGAEALAAARRDPPDMIISDILMPVMDGFTLCRQWKKDDQLQEIPFVFYTATYTDPRDEEFALGLGAERFIVKPVEPDEFIEIIRAVISDAEKGRIKLKTPTLEEGKETFKLYSEQLVKKLEKKMVDLEREVARRKRVEETLHSYTERLKTLRQVYQAILAARSPKAIAQATLRRICQLIPCRRASLVMFDFEGQQAHLLAVHTDADTPLSKDSVLPLEAFGFINELRKGEVRHVPDIPQSLEPHPVRPHLLAEGLRALMNAPLIVQGELIGCLNLGATVPGVFTQEHEAIACEVADQLAIAIQQAHLHEQARRHAGELEERVHERTAELRKMVNLMAGREVRMAELKDVIRQLRAQLEAAGLTPAADDPLITGRETEE